MSNHNYTDSVSGVTPNANLPQWNGTDKPMMQDFNEAFANVDAELGKKVNEVESAKWHNIPLTNGFIGYEGRILQCCRVGPIVCIRGAIMHETGVTPMPSEIAVLPEGFRPSIGVSRLCILSSGGGGGYARCLIQSNGVMVIDYTNNQASLNRNIGVEFSFAV